LEDIFVKQYSYGLLERYRQMPKEEKVLIIVNIDKMRFKDERRDKILNFLLSKYTRIILFSGEELDISMLIARLSTIDQNSVALRILYMRNTKRLELITKWYKMGECYPEHAHDLDRKIDQAMELVTDILGNYTKLVPATPLHVLGILQAHEASHDDLNQISQYGSLYENIINRSISYLLNINKSTINLYKAALSYIAFIMLQNNSFSLSKNEFVISINKFNEIYKVAIDTGDLLNNMQKVKILTIDSYGRFRFKYQYIYYYFAGRYIATHLGHDDVNKAIDHMSTRLYNEAYGNIMIFVCHFSNNIQIIESIILNAYSLFDKIKPFDYKDPHSILESANQMIERLLIPKTVGNESDVKTQKYEYLQNQDDAGVHDGSINTTNCENVCDEDEQANSWSELTNALKTMDVLGQIVKNFPGDVIGDNKVAIISEIHEIGMRIVQVFLDIFSCYQEDLIKKLADEARIEQPDAGYYGIINIVK
jgi:hypothetical protein